MMALRKKPEILLPLSGFMKHSPVPAGAANLPTGSGKQLPRICEGLSVLFQDRNGERSSVSTLQEDVPSVHRIVL
jgi:hypothetical protein